MYTHLAGDSLPHVAFRRCEVSPTSEATPLPLKTERQAQVQTLRPGLRPNRRRRLLPNLQCRSSLDVTQVHRESGVAARPQAPPLGFRLGLLAGLA